MKDYAFRHPDTFFGFKLAFLDKSFPGINIKNLDTLLQGPSADSNNNSLGLAL